MFTKSYSEMLHYSTFEDRFKYLALHGLVGLDTFGFDRYMNQMLYKSKEWQQIRYKVIVRDNGCDLGIPDRAIFSNIVIHHINPISPDDIKLGTSALFDLENLISVSPNTHRAIHYSDENLLVRDPIVRTKNDTIPWKTRR